MDREAPNRDILTSLDEPDKDDLDRPNSPDIITEKPKKNLVDYLVDVNDKGDDLNDKDQKFGGRAKKSRFKKNLSRIFPSIVGPSVEATQKKTDETMQQSAFYADHKKEKNDIVENSYDRHQSTHDGKSDPLRPDKEIEIFSREKALTADSDELVGLEKENVDGLRDSLKFSSVKKSETRAMDDSRVKDKGINIESTEQDQQQTLGDKRSTVDRAYGVNNPKASQQEEVAQSRIKFAAKQREPHKQTENSTRGSFMAFVAANYLSRKRDKKLNTKIKALQKNDIALKNDQKVIRLNADKTVAEQSKRERRINEMEKSVEERTSKNNIDMTAGSKQTDLNKPYTQQEKRFLTEDMGDDKGTAKEEQRRLSGEADKTSPEARANQLRNKKSYEQLPMIELEQAAAWQGERAKLQEVPAGTHEILDKPQRKKLKYPAPLASIIQAQNYGHGLGLAGKTDNRSQALSGIRPQKVLQQVSGASAQLSTVIAGFLLGLIVLVLIIN